MYVTRLAFDSALSGREIGKCMIDNGLGATNELAKAEFCTYHLVEYYPGRHGHVQRLGPDNGHGDCLRHCDGA